MDYDLLVIGGAAGRGLSVLLCERGDLEGTSSRSGKLVHGGLRYASAVTRDSVFDLELQTPEPDRAPLLSIFGGKITTYRKLAKLAPFFPGLGLPWTAGARLPGGGLPDAGGDRWLAGFRRRFSWLPADLAHRCGRLCGTRAAALLEGCGSLAALGRHFGGGLYERGVGYLIEREWAQTSEDVLERRTRHGLYPSEAERTAFAASLVGPQRVARST